MAGTLLAEDDGPENQDRQDQQATPPFPALAAARFPAILTA